LAWICAAAAGLALGAAACGNDKPNPTGTGGSHPDGGGTGGSDGGGSDVPADGPVGTPQKLVILHTNDIHSHLMGFAPEHDYSPATPNDDMTVGGMARLATAIGTAKATAAAAGTPVLLLDAGDFMMGSLFELLAQQAVPELTFMKALGYDATTLGNHELDWTPNGLAAILQAAVTKNALIPILSSNIKFNDTADGGAGDDGLKMFYGGASGPIQPKLVKMVGGLKVGFFGLLGDDAQKVTPQKAPLTFDPIADAATRMVNELRQTDKVDLVIALSHSGIDHDGNGEDATLAKNVAGIDIIISGHTHDTLAQPKVVNKTVIVTAGSYTANLGKLELTVTPSGTPGGNPTVAVDKYTLMNIDDKIPGDATTQAGVEQFIAGLNTALTGNGAPTYKQVIAKTSVDLALPQYQEAPIGNLVTDAYLAISGALQPSDKPVLAVEANGQLRAPIAKGTKGDVWFADLFRVLPIGIGPDQVPGYPLVTFYLNAKDIASGLELGAATGPAPALNDQYFLQVAGIKADFDMSKNVFGRVSNLRLADGTAMDVTNLTKCYKVVATNYVAGLLSLVHDQTGGALSVVAKAADCATQIDPTDVSRYVDADPATAGTQELKHWQALLKYVSSFPPAVATPDGGAPDAGPSDDGGAPDAGPSDDGGAPDGGATAGVPQIPAVYGVPQGRITKK
jgi:5'-nucleotidase